MTRRSWHERAVLFLSGLIGVGLTVPAVAYLFNPFRKEEKNGWTDAGELDAIPDDEPTELTLQRERKDAWKRSVVKSTTWIVRDGGSVTAFAPQCTHLGCGYRWLADKEHFLCPCHDSTFAKDGAVLTGPAPRALDRYEVRVEGRRLWLGDVRKSDEEA